MPTSVQQTKSPDTNDASAATVATNAFGSNPNAGNLIEGHVSWLGGINDLTSVTDGTNTYSIVDRWTPASGDSVRMATFLAQNIASGGSPLTVTGNFSPNAQYRRIRAREWSGVATTGQPNAHNKSADDATWSTATDAITLSVTTTVDGCQIIGTAYDEASATIPSAGTNYTPGDSASFGSGDAWRTEDKNQSTQGSVAATFTSASGAGHIGVGVLALVPSAPATVAVGSRRGRQLVHPGRHPDKFGKHIRTRQYNPASALATITGTSATTNNDDTATATGAVLPTPYIRRPQVHPGRGSFNLGKLFKSRRDNTPAATGPVTGTSATTNNNDTSATSGTTTVIGTVVYTNNNDTSTASGTTIVSGTSATTNNNDTSTASGTTTVKGTSTTTNINDASAASGTTTVKGTSATTDANDSVAASGWVNSAPTNNSRLPLMGIGT